ncbi:hypothetical protein DBIPINDM_007502 (plasmid) [Mesorhizobium sp. AR02]|uniref:hypothetical protein n=1 Tax=Mesorhizobium sp. AR02 TaxID=2865837 RepID=UPI0021609366|nr:hypothetical protein [Mesorhizobium sp. AR02]UVK50199.1 hypothetical protein DBIPINDM_007502 [Mesorhizobium sp. AR02]
MSSVARSLGILNLERGALAGESAADEAIDAFRERLPFPVIAETVEGAWADNVIQGDSALEPAYIAAARRLVARGAIAISANCGYSVRHQAAVASAVNVPVAATSLILLPLLLRQYPTTAKIAVIAADSSCLDEKMLAIHDPGDRARVVVGGIEGGVMWQNEMKRPPPYTEPADIEAEVMACLCSLQSEHTDIGAILFECTLFPLVSPAIRRTTGLPVYDITTLCQLTYAAA